MQGGSIYFLAETKDRVETEILGICLLELAIFLDFHYVHEEDERVAFSQTYQFHLFLQLIVVYFTYRGGHGLIAESHEVCLLNVGRIARILLLLMSDHFDRNLDGILVDQSLFQYLYLCIPLPPDFVDAEISVYGDNVAKHVFL